MWTVSLFIQSLALRDQGKPMGFLGYLRVDGVVEDPRESKVDVANQLIQVVIRLQPQGICGLVCFYDNLWRKEHALVKQNVWEKKWKKNLATKAKTLEPCKCFSYLIIGVGVHCPNLQEVERLFHLRWKWASCYISHSKSDYRSALRWSRQVVRNCLPYLGWYLGGHEVQPPCCQNLRDKREVKSTINKGKD